LKYFHLFCALLLGATSGGQCRTLRQVDEPPPVSESLHLFANDLYQLLERSEGNTVVSPLSLFTSLSMASLGANGLTLEEIHRTLRLTPEALSRMGGIIASFQDVEGFDMANFLWVPRGVLLRAEYARDMYDTFQTRVRDADFKRSELVRSLINRMIGNVTHGKIQEFLPTGAVNADTKVMMANAVYFKAEWFHPFDVKDTKEQPFFLGGDQSVNVPMMHLKETFRGAVLDELDSKAIWMSYKDNRFGLLVVLPNRYDGIDELELQLRTNNHTAKTLSRKMIHRDVDVALPRFRIQYGSEMANILRQMGITELFGPRADLTRMSGSPLAEKMKVSSVFHRATIEVNEGGSEASAASGLEIIPLIGPPEGQSGPMEFRADHPFMFYLVDRDNDNLPVFMGRVTNPLDGAESESLAITLKAAEAEVESPSLIDSGSDRVIYPEAASRSIRFPDEVKEEEEEPSISRVARDSGSVVVSPIEPEASGALDSVSETPDLILRVKDKNWFKKPTAVEVIIPDQGPSAEESAVPERIPERIPETTTRRVFTTTPKRRRVFSTRRPVTASAFRPKSTSAPKPNRGFNPSGNPADLDGDIFAFSNPGFNSGFNPGFNPNVNSGGVNSGGVNSGNPWMKKVTTATPLSTDGGFFPNLFGSFGFGTPGVSRNPELGRPTYSNADFGGLDSGVLFPNLRIVGKQVGDGIGEFFTSLTATAKKAES